MAFQLQNPLGEILSPCPLESARSACRRISDASRSWTAPLRSSSAAALSSCTLEVVAAEARISKPLIYKYFPRLADLFKALVEREYRFLRGRGLGVLPKNVPYEEVIHRSNLRSMEYLYERGPIMRLARRATAR